jgi:hypothetical protein
VFDLRASNDPSSAAIDGRMICQQCLARMGAAAPVEKTRPNPDSLRRWWKVTAIVAVAIAALLFMVTRDGDETRDDILYKIETVLHDGGLRDAEVGTDTTDASMLVLKFQSCTSLGAAVVLEYPDLKPLVLRGRFKWVRCYGKEKRWPLAS